MRTSGWMICIVLIVLMSACGQAGVVPATGGTGRAAVQSVEVVQRVGQSAELSVLVKGSLPDNCTVLANPVISQSGGLIVIILEQNPIAKAKNCTAVSVPYERSIPLGKDLPARNYSISVNGIQTTLALSAFGAAASGSDASNAVVSGAAASVSAVAGAAVTATTPADTTAAATATPDAAETSTAPTTQPSPTPKSTLVAPPAENPPAASASGTPCDNKAAFYGDVTVPDGTVFDPAQTFTKTWRIRNAGDCTWSGYLLVYQDGDPLNAQTPASVAVTIAPGDIANISVEMVAPDKPGSYYSDWLLSSSDGTIFGTGSAKNGLLWTKIAVRSLVPAGADKPVCAYESDGSVENQALALINQARQEKNLPPLTLNAKLSEAARKHSQDMACNDFVDHYGSDGSTWYSRIQAEGVRYGSANENIYAGDPQFGGTAQGAFTWWMNSQIHRDNILNPKATQIGVGYIYYSGSTYKGYFTLNFTGSK